VNQGKTLASRGRGDSALRRALTTRPPPGPVALDGGDQALFGLLHVRPPAERFKSVADFQPGSGDAARLAEAVDDAAGGLQGQLDGAPFIGVA